VHSKQRDSEVTLKRWSGWRCHCEQRCGWGCRCCRHDPAGIRCGEASSVDVRSVGSDFWAVKSARWGMQVKAPACSL